MSPLPGYKVIPDDWAAHHRATAQGGMTAECTVRRPGGPPPFPLPEGWTGEGEVLWSGFCRLQELKRENSVVAAEQPVETRQYLLGLPYDTPAFRVGERGDVAYVNGRHYTLKQSMSGSLLWERDYIAIENQTQQN